MWLAVKKYFRRRLEMHLLRVGHKQDWSRGFNLLPPGCCTAQIRYQHSNNNGIEPESGFVIQNRQIACPMYGARN